VNVEQREFLLSYMERNVLFSQGEFRCAMGREDFRNEWQKLADLLNNVPQGAKKDAAKWKTVCSPYFT